MKSLEEQLIKLNKLEKMDLKVLYRSFLKRVEEHGKNLDHKNEDSEQYRKVLSYLYAATLTKIQNLEMDLDSSLIIDVNGYLDLVKEDISTLKNLEDEDSKVKLINKYKNEYRGRIDKKIQESKDLIQKDVLPEFDKIAKEINKKINNLIKEILELEKKAEEDKEKLIEKKHELEEQMKFHMLFGVLKIFGAALSK